MNDSARAGRTPGVERLSASTCWEYVQQAALGRLAVIHADGGPDIFPVNHLAHEGSLFIRTARDPKLLHIAHHPEVAFEIDGRTDDAYWSVVIRGRAERLTSEDEVRESGVRALESWSPTVKLFVIKIVAHTITGRRFPADLAHADRVIAFEADATAPSDPGAPPPPRGERPAPIPHFGPRTGATPVAPPPDDAP